MRTDGQLQSNMALPFTRDNNEIESYITNARLFNDSIYYYEPNVSHNSYLVSAFFP